MKKIMKSLFGNAVSKNQDVSVPYEAISQIFRIDEEGLYKDDEYYFPHTCIPLGISPLVMRQGAEIKAYQSNPDNIITIENDLGYGQDKQPTIPIRASANISFVRYDGLTSEWGLALVIGPTFLRGQLSKEQRGVKAFGLHGTVNKKTGAFTIRKMIIPARDNEGNIKNTTIPVTPENVAFYLGTYAQSCAEKVFNGEQLFPLHHLNDCMCNIPENDKKPQGPS